MAKQWTQQQENIIAKHYYDWEREKLEKIIGRPIREIKIKAANLRKKGIKVKKRPHDYSEKFREKCRQGKLGPKNPQYGKPRTEQERQQIRETMRKKAKYGPENRFYKDGMSSLKERVRKSWKFRDWREAIFKRDDYTCQECGKKGDKLHPHHWKKGFAEIWQENKITTFEEAMNCEELWDVSNGKTLCENCHKKTETYGVNR